MLHSHASDDISWVTFTGDHFRNPLVFGGEHAWDSECCLECLHNVSPQRADKDAGSAARRTRQAAHKRRTGEGAHVTDRNTRVPWSKCDDRFMVAESGRGRGRGTLTDSKPEAAGYPDAHAGRQVGRHRQPRVDLRLRTAGPVAHDAILRRQPPSLT